MALSEEKNLLAFVLLALNDRTVMLTSPMPADKKYDSVNLIPHLTVKASSRLTRGARAARP